MMHKVLILVLVSLLLASCSAATPTATAALPTPAPALTQIIAFGDDLSDTGRLFSAVKDTVAQGALDPIYLENFEANYQGRFSNGPLAVEILADRLKVGLTSFAVGASYSGQGNINSDIESLNNTGLLGQIDQFEKGLNGAKADSGALYFINTSMVDVFTMVESGTDAINSYADQTLENIRTAITRLAKLGAKRFMFWNTSDIAPLMPGFIRNNFITPPKVFQDRMNSKLPGLISDLEKQLDIKIEPFDFRAVDAQIRNNPEKYGLTNLTGTCTQLPESIGDICTKPDEYYFWGDYYLTRRIHQILGEAMADQLKK
jgi:phospholipase/lecithinase/hemolysin